MPAIRHVDAAEIVGLIDDLSGILVDCVAGGASVNFMAPFETDKARSFWLGVGERVAAGVVELLVAESDGRVVGTVQLAPAPQDNQPHRADVAKMLVHRQVRRQGIGQLLMQAVEDLARRKGKTLLVLDTATGEDAERLYRRLGWTAIGSIPHYALFPDGRPCASTFFYKQLAG